MQDERVLPSGDVLVAFRLTVARPPQPHTSICVDAIDCTAVRARARRTLARACDGDVIEVVGSLQRRFWRTPGGPTSRYTVVVDSLRLLRPGRPGAA